ncbi:MAG: NUDIX hydrolase [Patescibacteria group bacterium]|jgi:8-oxo-dGTP pyrophosphatase MutT (NUDIX family)|nr:NUDIX hydrolase [Patescibacteria group bacterium]
MGKNKLPKKLKRTVIYSSNYINLYSDKVLMASGSVIEKYHILDYPADSVVALLVNSKNNICFIKALRYSTQKIEWELPAGRVEVGESPEEAADREVLEETGYKTKNLKVKQSFYPSNGMSNQMVHIVFGEIEESAQKSFDTDEVSEVEWMSIESVEKLLKSKKISDGISLLPILLYLNDIK